MCPAALPAVWQNLAGDVIHYQRRDIPPHARGNADKMPPTKHYAGNPTEFDVFSQFFTNDLIDIMVLGPYFSVCSTVEKKAKFGK